MLPPVPQPRYNNSVRLLGGLLIFLILVVVAGAVFLYLNRTMSQRDEAREQTASLQDEVTTLKTELAATNEEVNDLESTMYSSQVELELAEEAVANCQLGAGLLAKSALESLDGDLLSVIKANDFATKARKSLEPCFAYKPQSGGGEES